MKLLAVLILALALSAYAYEDADGFALNKKKKGGKKGKKVVSPPPPPPAAAEESQVGVSCSAFGALKIRTFGVVRCMGQVSADCVAVASAQNDFQEAYAVWFGEGTCDKVHLEEAAVAIATACAAVYSKTLAKVECTGAGGFACGYSMAQGEAYASAMAKAIAQAAVDTGGVSADAFCIADVEAIVGTIAEAAASSQSKACVSGFGSEEDFQEAFIETVGQAIADALVTATASTCDETGAAAASSKCTGEGGGDVKETKREKKSEKGKTESKVAVITQCSTDMKECCDPDYASPICTCSEASCAGTWMRLSKTGDHNRTWRNPRTREVCQCYK